MESATAEIIAMAGQLSTEAFGRPDIASAFPTAVERDSSRARVEQYVVAHARDIAAGASEERKTLHNARASARERSEHFSRARQRRESNFLTAVAAVLVVVIGAVIVSSTWWVDTRYDNPGDLDWSQYRQAPLWLWLPAILVVLGAVGLACALIHVTWTRDLWAKAAPPDAQEVQALTEWRERVFEVGVMQRLGTELALLTPSFDARLQPRAESALVDMTEAAQFVETASSDELRRLSSLMPTASIGISGPRGAGKTALLTRLTDERLHSGTRGLAVLVQAPTSYDAREFLVDLFAQVCRKVAGAAADVPPVPRTRGLLAGPLPLPGRRTVLLAAGVTAIVVSGLWPWWPEIGTWLRTSGQLLVGAAGVLATATWVVLFWRSRDAGPQTDPLIAEAVRHLHSLQYLRTHTAEWAGKANLTVGDVTRKQTLQHAERISTYPELVRQFRDFLGRVGLAQRAAADGDVVTTIGIDEIDKIGSPEDAERFLNDIKVIFGVTNCHYLVSVSDDALAAFDRRALTVRTVFDSSFDFVIRIGSLRLDETRQLMFGRLLRIPEPFVALCHVLSGGLPRDLVRVARRLLDMGLAEKRSDLSEVASLLILGDLRTVLDGQSRLAMRSEGDDARRWLSDTRRLAASSAELLAQYGEAVQDTHVYETKVYLYYAATLMELFVDRTAELVGGLRDGVLQPVVDHLADARGNLATDPHRSWHLIDQSREELKFARSPEPPRADNVPSDAR
jgi:hypothetical protein